MNQPRAIVGTAGHIDHGKSALVRALTGIETDRLPEERERGISIELGFAHLDLPGLGRVGVVDVPGHERFIRQMLAGAHGFDLVLMVVAADDGVMPQTEEHFDIVHLLGVRRAIFVITKIDAVPAERVDEVRGEIEILAVGTPFESSPVLAVSARSGEGIEALRASIGRSLEDLQHDQATRDQAGFRVPIDRVFVVKGHGVVVTGTALAGAVSVGDDVVLLPDGPQAGDPSGGATRSARRSARVREIQVHGESVPRAGAGQRVALNLAGIDKEQISRGDTVAEPGVQGATLRLDARIEVRPAAGSALASHVRVRVHHGTRQTLARLVWLDGVKEVSPRQSGLAQLSLVEPLVAMAGDRFVIRDETASRTLGGGQVLLARAARHRRSQGEVRAALEALESADDLTRLHTVLRMATSPAVDVAEASAAIGLSSGAARDMLEKLKKTGGDRRVVALGEASSPQWLLAAERLDAWLHAIEAQVTDYEAAHPNLPGVDLEHLRSVVRPPADPRLFRLLLDRLLERGTLRRRGNLVHSKDHAASLSGRDEALASRLLARIVESGFMPPTLKELGQEFGVEAAHALKVVSVLVLRGDLVKVTPELFFSPSALEEIRERLETHLRREGEITASGFRDLIAASRKYGIPLLDWFDGAGVTIRVGDVRKLRRA